jgi:hypothetical protein
MSARSAFVAFALASTLVAPASGCSGTSVTDLRDPNAADASAPGTGTSPGGGAGGGEQNGSGPTDPNTPPDPTVTPSADEPVEIRNVSFTAAKSRGYGPEALDITLAVLNRAPRPIERLKEVSLTFGGGGKKTFAIVCDGVWFGTLGTTKILTLHLEDGGGEGYLFPTCGEPASGPTTMPWGGTVQVELKGLLDDASPWTASATGTR